MFRCFLTIDGTMGFNLTLFIHHEDTKKSNKKTNHRDTEYTEKKINEQTIAKCYC